MRKALAIACAVAACIVASQARAEVVVNGSVLAPAPTGPSAARHAFLFSDKLDGIAGDVVEIEPSAQARPFELEGVSGAIGDEDLDVYFYTALEGTGTPCERLVTGQLPGGGESGVMCAGARWAIVTLFQGADADFQLRF